MEARRFMVQGRTLAVLIALALGSTACSWLVGSWAGAPKPASTRDNIVFSHKFHIEEQSAECGACHEGVEESESLQTSRFLPPEAACMECHEKEDNCKMCHANPTAPQTFVDTRMPGIRFSHKNHVTRKVPESGENGCNVCHKGIEKTERISDHTRPPMFAACGQCHRTTFRKDNCTTCHLPGTMREVSPEIYDHGGDWQKRHGAAAKSGGDVVCGHCHKPDTCAECHSRSNIPVRPSQLNLNRPEAQFHHRGDYLTRHPIEAKLDSKACTTCHEPTTCTECHSRMGVAADKGLGKGHNPHPPGFLQRGGASFHGDEVRRDPLACAACHDQGAASNCVTCHRTGGPGGNPHPGGAAYQSGQSKTAPACLPCHK
jgi:hypothetical protein